MSCSLGLVGGLVSDGWNRCWTLFFSRAFFGSVLDFLPHGPPPILSSLRLSILLWLDFTRPSSFPLRTYPRSLGFIVGSSQFGPLVFHSYSEVLFQNLVGDSISSHHHQQQQQQNVQSFPFFTFYLFLSPNGCFRQFRGP